MSFFDCPCPLSGALTAITEVDCEVHLGQVQRLVFVKKGKVIWNSASTDTTPPATGDGVPQADSRLDTLADWLLRKSASDDTKMVFTPTIKGDPIITAGEAITSGGGDNSTLNGVEEINGTNPSVFTAVFKGLTGKQERELKALMCHELEVYLFLQGNRIAYNADITKTENSGELATGFEIQSMFVGDRNNQGFGTKDTNAISFSLPAGWSSNLEILKVPFNLLTDL